MGDGVVAGATHAPGAGGAGLACGVVASAKYVGLVWILFALVALRPRNGDGARSRVSRWRVPFFAALLGALAAINYPMLLAPVAARKGIGYESFHVVSSHLALVVPRLSSARFVLLWRETPPPVLVVGLAWIGWCVATWRRRSGFERFMALFPVGFFALTHASVVAWGRYLLRWWCGCTIWRVARLRSGPPVEGAGEVRRGGPYWR